MAKSGRKFDMKDRIAGQPSWDHKFGLRAIPATHKETSARTSGGRKVGRGR